jgi:hypothetical protein
MSYICLILSGAWPAGWLPAGITAVLIAGLFAASLVISKTGRSQTPANQGPVPARLAEPVSA